jgi:C1A family cysteine protease
MFRANGLVELSVTVNEPAGSELFAEPENTGPELTGPLHNGVGRGGWHPDLPDHRDFPFVPDGRDIPESKDLRELVEVVPFDQGPLPSCTSNAVAAALRYRQAAQGMDDFLPSRMYMYWNERHGPGRPRSEGVSLRAALKSLNAYGVSPEELWPYRASTVDRNPSLDAYEAARYNGDVNYQRLHLPADDPKASAEVLRACIASDYPVLFGLTVYDNFKRVGDGGVVEPPAKGARALFGHAGLIIGYGDDGDGAAFTCQNSWGSDWGRGGFYSLRASYLTDRTLAQDFWTITALEQNGSEMQAMPRQAGA